jgi:hypothetical protein
MAPIEVDAFGRRRTVKWLAMVNLTYILTTMLVLAADDFRKFVQRRMKRL